MRLRNASHSIAAERFQAGHLAVAKMARTPEFSASAHAVELHIHCVVNLLDDKRLPVLVRVKLGGEYRLETELPLEPFFDSPHESRWTRDIIHDEDDFRLAPAKNLAHLPQDEPTEEKRE